MRILWVSDGPSVPSGYGSQTALFLPLLRRIGHEVALLAMGGSAGATYETPDGMLVYPTVGDPRGNDIVRAHAMDHRADLVITLGDPHGYSPAPSAYGGLSWCAWAPLDFESPTRATLRSLQGARWVWSPSILGKVSYRKAGIEAARYVPHGADGEIFRVGDREEARRALGKALGVEISLSVFLVVAVAANKGTPSRKGFYELLSASKDFFGICKEALLYLHTEESGIAGGEDIRAIMQLVGIDPKRVIFPPQYELVTGRLGLKHLASAYQAADVYLSASHGEGFSIPLLESQLCGTPVIVPENTAQTEMCLTGHIVPVTPYMPFDGATLWGRPSVSALVGALEATWQAGPLSSGDKEAVFERVAKYEAERVFREIMQPALAEIEADVTEPVRHVSPRSMTVQIRSRS